MARNPEQNARIREQRQAQILDAALDCYVRCGYHGTDVDEVAQQAMLAKGLVYYYYCTKKALFQALYRRMIGEAQRFSDEIMRDVSGEKAARQLSDYLRRLSGARHMIPFFVRIPLDVKAIFGDEAVEFDVFPRAIEDIITQGTLSPTDPHRAAEAVWAVISSGSDPDAAIGFCLRGLGMAITA